jgi:hypothetical protein
VPTAQISWTEGNNQVGEPDSELADDLADRAKRAGANDADLIAQVVTFALACHRAIRRLWLISGFRKRVDVFKETTIDSQLQRGAAPGSRR